MPKAKFSTKDRELVVEYLKQQNRPFNVQMLFLNLHKAVGKSSLQCLLDALVEEEVVTLKVVKKSKLYWFNQDNIPIPNEEELAEIDSEIKDLTQSKKDLENEVSTLQKAVSLLKKELSDEELEARLKNLEKRTAELAQKLSSLENSSDKPVDTETRKKVQQSLVTNLDGWRKRKRLCNNILDTMCEHMDKRRKELQEMFDIEVDEDHQVNYNDIAEAH